MNMLEKKVTPVMRQYLDIKEKHPDKLVFFRMGDFYEMFYEDAELGAKILSITLTQRGGIPMCGIPHHQLDNYIYKITNVNKKAVIVEQMENPAEAKGIVKRDVARIITPGTVSDGQILDEKSNNFLLSINMHTTGIKNDISVAVMDISTGQTEIIKINSADLKKEIEAVTLLYSPKEILLPEKFDDNNSLSMFFHDPTLFIINFLPDYLYRPEYSESKIKAQFNLHSLKGISLDNDTISAGAFYTLIHYARKNQKEDLKHLKLPIFINRSKFMFIDAATQKNLELVKNMQDSGKKNTLLDAIDYTTTAMGARLLKNYLLKPLLNKKDILERHQPVIYFHDHFEERNNIKKLFKSIFDFERLCSKLSTSRILPREMIALKNSLLTSIKIVDYLNTIDISFFKYPKTDILKKASLKIEKTILNEPSNTITEGNLIKSNIDKKLAEYHRIQNEGTQWLATLQKEEKEKTKINNLKIKYNDNIGYFFEVSKGQISNIPDYFIKKQTLVNCERFTTEKLSNYQDQLLEAEDNVNNLEYKIYCKLRDDIALQIPLIQELSGFCAHLDVIISFAENAVQNNYVCPKINESTVLNIKDGRHPVIEKNINNNFIPNSLNIGLDESLIHIITGPNMSGKSTYLRQNALIVLLAQIGSFVPAKSAEIGICDRIFTRVGASDNLAKGESTFLVEMNETATILNNATSNSLIIMDEIGRGTSTYDGLSLAWAIIDYILLNQRLKAKTLFATHYHELTVLGEKKGIENHTVTVMDKGNEVVFLKKVVKGAADKSYGIHVAELAGLPKEIIKQATKILKTLEEKDKKSPEESIKTESSEQLTFYNNIESPLNDMIKKFDVENSTPMDALNFINQLKREVDN